MSWFKRSKGFEKIDDLDLSACFDSFNKHWQQTSEIINRFQVSLFSVFLKIIIRLINRYVVILEYQLGLSIILIYIYNQ